MSPFHVVLFDKNHDYIEILSFIFKDVLKTHFVSAFTLIDAIKYIPKSGPTLFIVDDNLYADNNLPKEVSNNQTVLFKIGQSVGCKSIRSFALPELLIQLQKEAPMLPTIKDEFCTVPLALLKKINHIVIPIHAKINDKMVALTKAESIFGQSELDKYRTKGIDALYVKCTNVTDLISLYLQNIVSLQQWSDIDTTTISKELAVNTTRLKGLASTLGWNAQVAEVTKQNLEKALQIVKSYPKFSSVLNYYQKSGEFSNADHDSLALMVAFNILERTNRMTEMNKVVIALASLLHDISLEPAEIENEATLRKQLFERGPNASDSILKYFNHPINGAALCKEWRFAPPLVADIILQHHEKPDGTGFPNNITAEKFDKTTATFIIAQDFAEYFAMYQGNPNYANYINSRAKLFEPEPFKAPFVALQELFKDWVQNQNAAKKL